MDHFHYRQGLLHAEEVPLAAIAAAVGTPFYCYSSATIERHLAAFRTGLAGLDTLVCYALKANSNQAVIATLARGGAGADVVSGGELERALRAGVPAERIVFSGVGKTAEEMAQALAAGILQFNVESEPELLALDAVARRLGKRAAIALQVNPDVDAGTHDKITTGRKENKFGIAIEAAPRLYRQAAGLSGLRPASIAMHIGSQLTDLRPFEAAFGRLRDLALRLRRDGIALERLDLGGGLGIPYGRETPPTPADYALLVRRLFGDLGLRLMFEPGRLIVGNAGILVSRVLYVKQAGRRFVVCDAAMNDLLRPAMYDAWHAVVPLNEPAPGAPLAPADLVGPVCESADVFAKERALPPLGAGDLIALRTAGAYGAVMASTYNTRPLLPEVLVRGHEFFTVRPRQTLEALIGQDRLPPWLSQRPAKGAA